MARFGTLLLSFGLFCSSIGFCSMPPHARVAADTGSSTVVRTAMKNVEFHLTDRIVIYVAALNGKLTPKQGEIAIFDDKSSFGIDVDSANVSITPAALSNDMNDFVFANPDAPLKKLSATIKDDELTVKGLLVSKGGIPFETTGTLSVTPEGLIRVHTKKVKALKLPVKGLMDMLGIDTQKLIDTQKTTGVSVDKDDLILDPGRLLPPPQLTGHLTSVAIANGTIELTFGGGQDSRKSAPVKETCAARNFVGFKGGSVRFGKLTMTDADLELVDANPADPFDFSLDHYRAQLVAGYSKSTPQNGLCVHMPDFNKIHHAANESK
jgi:hypothetical protein